MLGQIAAVLPLPVASASVGSLSKSIDTVNRSSASLWPLSASTSAL